MRPIITLVTDFGTADGYVGEMKGVLLAMAPESQIIDVSHEIAAQDVEGARLAVARVWRRFPERTVHVVVVDPGVGSDRAALAIQSDGRFLVGPDNGVLSAALLIPGARAVALTVPAHAAPTFYGRDVFAPAAALLATGTAIDLLGHPHEAPVIRRTPEVTKRADGVLVGQVIAVDRFGNLITNFVAPRGGVVELQGRAIPLGPRSYADVHPGSIAALVGSTGLVEIAMRDGDAARALGLARGAEVLLRPSR